MIKYILPLFLALNAHADTPALQCTTVQKVVCPDEKAIVIKKVRKPRPPVIVEKVVEKIVYVKADTAKPKRNIVSLYAQRKVTSLHTSTSVSSGTASARTESQSSIVPGVQYQRLFDSGFVLGIGVDTQAEVLGSIGLQF